METTNIHLELEIPLEQQVEDLPQEDEIPDPISLGGKIVGGTAKIIGTILGGIYDVVKPGTENAEENLE